MKELFKDLAIYTSAALGAYTVLLTLAGAVENFCSRRIRTKSELEEAVEKEGIKQGIKDITIVDFIEKSSPRYKKIRGSRASVSAYDKTRNKLVPPENADESKGIYPINIVEIKEGLGANTGAVKHEVYHLKYHLPGPKNKILSGLKYFFYDEPAAILYSLRNLKN